jgi:hypothetical protein
MTRPTISRIILGLFILAITVVACNNKSSENKESTVDTTNNMAPMPKMDTSMHTMDTGSTKPVNPGN